MNSDQDVRERCARFLKSRPDLTTADLASHTGLGTSTVKKFLNGLQPETERVRAEMQRVMNLVDAGEILTAGGGRALTVTESVRARRVVRRRGFYETETVRRVSQVLDWCAENAAIGVITADYGVGKTEGVAAWRRGAGRDVETCVIELDEFVACNKVSFIQELAETLGLPHQCSTTHAAKLFRAVCDHLRKYPCLLVFDQCELARARVCQVIRQLWDRTRDAGVGVVMLAAPVLMSRLKNMQDLGALDSRVGVYAPLVGISREAMAAIVKAEGITDVEDAAFDLWWRACGGSMRRLMAIIDLLKTRHEGKRVTERTIHQVAGNLLGLQFVAGSAA